MALKEKGGGKGNLGKGKDKGKGGKPELLAITDKSEEEQLEESLHKCRKMRDMCATTLYSLEESVSMAKKSKFWSKAAQNDARELMDEMNEHMLILKKALTKKAPSVVYLKEIAMNAALKVKACQAQTKEYKQLANKTSSKASAK